MLGKTELVLYLDDNILCTQLKLNTTDARRGCKVILEQEETLAPLHVIICRPIFHWHVQDRLLGADLRFHASMDTGVPAEDMAQACCRPRLRDSPCAVGAFCFSLLP